ncbi:hypothetical protein SERLA73DRAFT_181195 [Serpula lacrymans var. lacrymans S7.3]|uniref:DUF453-domain-containing protein n=2 Tax=Serpula lacrymans var. lacrymans TaxID=341189 RepID=F8PXM5_SERL3|nr:uncharacterized protein SERLADRAFT_467130 [Serpula lacrymans var. lacrymans S7.9]EGN98638.1 hypothetical protein SERLA73DRAFT_181195 [Serpula lacrymans var. lacrymans S7.3]EGO24207.1 hypothetical protein SERLADRAFT_467130 [Serpula lacrymans var. lacrymans S7.9]
MLRSTLAKTLNPLPATFLRGGTSKGIFINRDHLPKDRNQWNPIFLGIMGSPDPEHGRQLNGMGGGISSLSKICVVGSPTSDQVSEGYDAEYTFVQVGIRDSSIDYSGNCGNLSSMIGVFALDEGICTRTPTKSGSLTTRLFNTNTNKRIDTTFPVSLSDDKMSPLLDLPQVSMAGVPGRASQITLDFINPAGARTGSLLPTGKPINLVDITVQGKTTHIPASLVDATNPTVFITADGLRPIVELSEGRSIDFSKPYVGEVLESIRQQGARLMGLDPSAQAQPKIAVLSPSSDADYDITVHALSMGVLHKAVPMTVGLCLGVAANIEGTVAWTLSSRESDSGGGLLKIKHPSGLVDVGADFEANGTVKSAKVVRTGRMLMRGAVWW